MILNEGFENYNVIHGWQNITLSFTFTLNKDLYICREMMPHSLQEKDLLRVGIYEL